MVKHMTDINRGRILAHKAEGKSCNAICKLLGINWHTVKTILERNEAGLPLGRKEGSGRPRKTSIQTDRAIVRSVKANRFTTAREIQDALKAHGEQFNGQDLVSEKTIRRRIKESGEFNSYWAAKKPFISEMNRAKRVEWRRGRCPRSCAEYTLGHLPGNYNVMAHCFSRDDCPAPVVNLACVLHVLQEWSLAPMAVTQPAVLVLSGFLCSGTSCVGCCTAGICTYENGCCRRRKWLGPLLCSSLVMV
mmetsp:Transcript_18904/g.31620  ORF Transcript_18904/g.31620 Transcript_18904/m.31620 type:complete len:248 (+) Transcript_18904:46-789(+)